MADIPDAPPPPDIDEGAYWIWTIQLAKHREAKKLNITLFDITVKSGIQAFSPTWDMLRALRAGEMTTDEYERQYRQKVERTFEASPELWHEFTKHPNMAIGCYCTPGTFCHRLIFSDILTKYLCDQGKEVHRKGELSSAAQMAIETYMEGYNIKGDVDEYTNIPL